MAAVGAVSDALRTGIYYCLKKKEFTLYFGTKTQENEEYDEEARRTLSMSITVVYYYLYNVFHKSHISKSQEQVNTHPIVLLIRKYFQIPYVLKMIPKNVSFEVLEEASCAFAKYGYDDISFLIMEMIPSEKQNGKWIRCFLYTFSLYLHMDMKWNKSNGAEYFLYSKRSFDILNKFFEKNQSLFNELIRTDVYAYIYYSWAIGDKKNAIINIETEFGKIESEDDRLLYIL